MENELIANIFREALARELRERGAQRRCAEASHVSPQVINDLLKGRKAGSEETRRAIAAGLGYRYEELLDVGRAALGLPKAAEGVPAAAAATGEGFGYVRRVKAILGCGGSFLTDGESLGWYAFRKDFFHEVGRPQDLVLFEASGDSMQPTIVSGDLVLLNITQKTPHEGELFGVRVGNQLMAKRIFFRPGVMELKSDNPAAGGFTVAIGPESQEDFAVIGKVRWMCRIL